MYIICLQKQCAEKHSDNNEDFTKHLQNFQKCGCPHEGTDLCQKCHEFWPYILNHLKDTRCKQNICALWYVSLHL